MPSERLRTYSINDPDFVYTEPKPQTSLRDRLLVAGFQPYEVADYFFLDRDYMSLSWMSKLSNEDLVFLANSVKDREVRGQLLHTAMNIHFDDSAKGLPEAIHNISVQSEDYPDLPVQLNSYLATQWKSNRSESSFFTRLCVGAKTMSIPELFDVFERDSRLLHTYFEDDLDEGYYGRFVQMFQTDEDMKNKIKGLNHKLIVRLVGQGTRRLTYQRETLEIANQVLVNGDNWADRIAAFKPMFRAEGIDIKNGAERDQKLLERIRRRENPLHPLVTTGIARTVGFEIEYEDKFPEIVTAKSKKINALLEVIGYAFGGGGDGCDEISPGPFFDPETAVTVYKMFSDAGFVDLGRTVAMTCHFNVQELNNTSTLIPLIRAMYATGALYDPHIETRWKEIILLAKTGRTEAKVFDVTNDQDFIWGFRAASYLNWALASEETARKGGAISPRRTELAKIWKEYRSKMEDGLRSIGAEGYLEMNETQTSMAEWFRRELQAIYPDPYYRTLPDINVGPKSPGEIDPNNIHGVAVEDKWWPNICAYSTEATEQAVGQIIDLADEVERECIEDIKSVEGKQTRRKRLFAIRKFIKKYNTPFGDEPNAMENAFNKVRDLLLPN